MISCQDLRLFSILNTFKYFFGKFWGQDPDAEDAAQIVRTLAVHPHCGCHMCIIVELFKPEKAASVIWDDII
jgi:potassium large conductance calcium-activated channel subfamily M alpha protein 1